MMSNFRNSHMLYSVVEMQRNAMLPLRIQAEFNKNFFTQFYSDSRMGRSMSAFNEVFERMTRHYEEPEFGITSTKVNGEDVRVSLRTIEKKSFCRLKHFQKKSDVKQPKMLVVPPLSGHYATLCRGTIAGLLPHYDVYVTDWENARDVPLDEGAFHFDDFVNYSMQFMRKLGPDLNVLAVCQPAVPVLSAVAIMAHLDDPMQPATLTMMGGPVDTRKNPTGVNDYAAERTIQWFENNAITRVPLNYEGAGRLVYPGFMQLFGFMAMNLKTHVESHVQLFNHLVEGDGDSAESHRKFYNEYLAVMDMPAEFYLETVNHVFKEYALPLKKLISCGVSVDLEAIKKTALLAIEGERDDISGRGQTKAALTLSKSLADSKKQYHLQKGAGHYGIFNGKRYREQVLPVINAFIRQHGGADAKSIRTKTTPMSGSKPTVSSANKVSVSLNKSSKQSSKPKASEKAIAKPKTTAKSATPATKVEAKKQESSKETGKETSAPKMLKAANDSKPAASSAKSAPEKKPEPKTTSKNSSSSEKKSEKSTPESTKQKPPAPSASKEPTATSSAPVKQDASSKNASEPKPSQADKSASNKKKKPTIKSKAASSVASIAKVQTANAKTTTEDASAKAQPVESKANTSTAASSQNNSGEGIERIALPGKSPETPPSAATNNVSGSAKDSTSRN